VVDKVLGEVVAVLEPLEICLWSRDRYEQFDDRKPATSDGRRG